MDFIQYRQLCPSLADALWVNNQHRVPLDTLRKLHTQATVLLQQTATGTAFLADMQAQAYPELEEDPMYALTLQLDFMLTALEYYLLRSTVKLSTFLRADDLKFTSFRTVHVCQQRGTRTKEYVYDGHGWLEVNEDTPHAIPKTTAQIMAWLQ